MQKFPVCPQQHKKSRLVQKICVEIGCTRDPYQCITCCETKHSGHQLIDVSEIGSFLPTQKKFIKFYKQLKPLIINILETIEENLSNDYDTLQRFEKLQSCTYSQLDELNGIIKKNIKSIRTRCNDLLFYLSKNIDEQLRIFNKKQEAKTLSRKLQQAQEETFSSLQELGNDFYMKNNFDRAFKFFDEAHQLKPKDLRILFNKAQTLNKQMKFQQAVDVYDQILEIEQDNYDALINKGNKQNYVQGQSQQQLIQYQMALKTYNQILKENPEDNLALLNKGHCYQGLNQYDLAIKSYEKCLKSNPNDYKILYHKGEALRFKGKFKEALDAYDKFLLIDQSDIQCLFSSGKALEQLKQFDQAIIKYDQILRIDENNIQAIIHKANLLQKCMQFHQAIELYDKVLHLDQDNIEAMLQLAKTQETIHNYQNACDLYDRILQINQQHQIAFQKKKELQNNLNLIVSFELEKS
ncbi:hypothetical protein pb186bvf_006838 [Paramecium bursaria]